MLDGNGWKSIEKVTCRKPEGKLRTVVYGDGGDAYVDLAPAQVVRLCTLVRDDADPESVKRWSPEVHMVCTFCDGTPCEIDPASVCSVDTIRLPGERSTLVTCEDGSTSCFVREPVAVVEAMRDACKEGE